jgi:hypothetical protein
LRDGLISVGNFEVKLLCGSDKIQIHFFVFFFELKDLFVELVDLNVGLFFLDIFFLNYFEDLLVVEV